MTEDFKDIEDMMDVGMGGMEEMMDIVGKKAPEIIKNIMKTIYSEEAGTQIGKGVAALYKELIAAGIDKKEAIEMAKDYLNAIKEMAPDMNQSDSNKNFNASWNPVNENKQDENS